LRAELRQVEEESLAGNQVVLEGELDEDRQLGAPAVGDNAKPSPVIVICTVPQQIKVSSLPA
jgi:hypothetical protein